MDDLPEPSGHKPLIRILLTLLRGAQIILGLAALLMVLAALIFAIPSRLRDTVLEGIETSGLPSMTALAVACLGSAIIAAAWYAVLHMLIRVVRTVQDGDPFIEANIGRLRGMWILIAVTEIFRMIVHSVADLALETASVSSVETGLDIRIGTWFLVFVIATLSEAFRHGAALRRDQELTI